MIVGNNLAIIEMLVSLKLVRLIRHPRAEKGTHDYRMSEYQNFLISSLRSPLHLLVQKLLQFLNPCISVIVVFNHMAGRAFQYEVNAHIMRMVSRTT